MEFTLDNFAFEISDIKFIWNFYFRVEFQNKFYTGLGHKFQPFSFRLILSGEIEIWYFDQRGNC